MAIEVLVPGVPEPILVEIGGLLGPPGNDGASGVAGPGYALPIETALLKPATLPAYITFTPERNHPNYDSYHTGMRVRLALTPSIWMEGVVTDMLGASGATPRRMQVLVDLAGVSSGIALSGYELSVAGERGMAGAEGPAGTPGGPPGPTGPAPAGTGFVWVIDGDLQTPVEAGTTAGKLLMLGAGDTLTLNSTGADGVGIIVTAGGSTAGVFESVNGEGLSVTSTNSNAATFIAGGSGSAFIGFSESGTGAQMRTTSGTYHATFGDTGDDRSAIERVRGWLVWFFGAFTGRLKTADITTDREWKLPDADGTVGIVPEFADAAAANAAVSVGDAWYDTTLGKTRVRLI